MEAFHILLLYMTVDGLARAIPGGLRAAEVIGPSWWCASGLAQMLLGGMEIAMAAFLALEHVWQATHFGIPVFVAFTVLVLCVICFAAPRERDAQAQRRASAGSKPSLDPGAP